MWLIPFDLLLSCPCFYLALHSSSLTDVVSRFFDSSGLRNTGKKVFRGIFACDFARMHSRFRWRSTSAQIQAPILQDFLFMDSSVFGLRGLFFIIFTR